MTEAELKAGAKKWREAWKDDTVETEEEFFLRMITEVVGEGAADANAELRAALEQSQRDHAVTTGLVERLRGELETKVGVINEMHVLLAGAKKDAKAARADNEALRGRLVKANEALAAAIHVLMRPENIAVDAEVFDARMMCMQAQDAIARTGLASPPATEPRGEAADETCRHVSPNGELCGHYRDSAWHRDVPGSRFPGHTFVPAPASAQGTGERTCKECGLRGVNGLCNVCASNVHNKTLKQLRTAVDLAIDNYAAAVANAVAEESDRKRRIAEPPQPAPVAFTGVCQVCGELVSDGREVHRACETAPGARHAFEQPRAFHSFGLSADQIRCAFPDCGQPRSAAVHGEGGK